MFCVYDVGVACTGVRRWDVCYAVCWGGAVFLFELLPVLIVLYMFVLGAGVLVMVCVCWDWVYKKI